MADYENYNLENGIKLALDYLKNTDLSHMENGKYEILGDKIFFSIQDYQTKNIDEAKLEAHKKYVDIEYMIEGEEKIGICYVDECSPVSEYDENKDIVFLNANDSDVKFISLVKGEHFICTPVAAHMSSLTLDNPSHVKKAVVKVAL